MPTYEKRSVLDVTPTDLFAWHTRPGAFERLAPPWEHIRVLSRYGGIADGARVTMVIKRGPMTIRWEALHRGFVDGVQFQDVQVSGPFKRWIHTHRFEPAGEGRATLIDHVDFALPFGLTAVAGVFARRADGSHVRIQASPHRDGSRAPSRARPGPAPAARADGAGRLRVVATGRVLQHRRPPGARLPYRGRRARRPVRALVGPDGRARLRGARAGRCDRPRRPSRRRRHPADAGRTRQPRARRRCPADGGRGGSAVGIRGQPAVRHRFHVPPRRCPPHAGTDGVGRAPRRRGATRIAHPVGGRRRWSAWTTSSARRTTPCATTGCAGCEA